MHAIHPVLHHSHDIRPSLLQKSAQELYVTVVEHSWHLIVAGARTFCTFLYINSEVQSHALKDNQEASSYLRVSRSSGAVSCAALSSRALSKCVIPQLRLEPCTCRKQSLSIQSVWNKVCYLQSSDLSLFKSIHISLDFWHFPFKQNHTSLFQNQTGFGLTGLKMPIIKIHAFQFWIHHLRRSTQNPFKPRCWNVWSQFV